jgi:hypothetical protein
MMMVRIYLFTANDGGQDTSFTSNNSGQDTSFTPNDDAYFTVNNIDTKKISLIE